jgi:hypothetical protein
MVHKIFLSIAILLLPSLSFGQFEINKHIAGPSIGFSFLGSTTQIGLNHEYAVLVRDIGINEPGILGVGGIFRYWSYSENFANVDWSYTDILLGVQTNYHFYFKNDNIDPWFGLVFAYDFGSVKSKIKTVGFMAGEESHGGFWIAANAGMRYWIKNNLAINVRIGFGTLSYGALDLGIDYKF